jgi:DNA invertase Pin-like site-specific DNA recombinase
MSGGLYAAYPHPMPGLNIGCARVSTDQQDLTAQHDGLQALGVTADTVQQIADEFGVTRPTIYRHLQRHRD